MTPEQEREFVNERASIEANAISERAGFKKRHAAELKGLTAEHRKAVADWRGRYQVALKAK